METQTIRNGNLLQGYTQMSMWKSPPTSTTVFQVPITILDWLSSQAVLAAVILSKERTLLGRHKATQ